MTLELWVSNFFELKDPQTYKYFHEVLRCVCSLLFCVVFFLFFSLSAASFLPSLFCQLEIQGPELKIKEKYDL